MNLEEIKQDVHNFFSFPIDKLEYAGQRFDSFVFGIDDRILKLICPFQGYSGEESMLSEVKGFSLMGAVPNLTLPIPHLYDHGDFTYKHRPAPSGRKIEYWLVMSRLKGHPDTFDEMLKYPAAIDELARFLVSLHQQQPALPSKTRDSVEEITIQAKERASAEEWALMSSLVNDFYATEKSEEVLVHGDMNAHNILLDSGRISGIIDFCETRYSEPEIDMNPILATNEKFYQVFLERYIAHGGKQPNAKAVYLLGAIRSLSGSIWNREARRLEKSAADKKRGLDLARIATSM
jgi:hypothetical protein